MPFVRFPDSVHKTTVQLQNQLYSILSKYNLYDISNSNDYQFTHLKNSFQALHLQQYYYVYLSNVNEENVKEKI